MKNLALCLGIAIVAGACYVLLSSGPPGELKEMDLKIKKLQEQFKGLDAV